MSSTQRRITQRAPQSCVYCSRRKLRCSKTIPCTNCIERGIQVRCHREAVILSNQSLRQRSRPPVSPASHEQSAPSPDPSVEAAPKSIQAPALEEHMLDSLDAHSQTRLIGENDQASNVSDSSNARRTLPLDEPLKAAPMDQHDGDLAIEAAMSLESLAWGTTHLENSRLLPSPSILTLIEELQSFINAQKAREIIRFHKTHVAWMHNVLYMPFFMRECEGYLSGRLQRDAAWLSLYCAVLCVSKSLLCTYVISNMCRVPIPPDWCLLYEQEPTPESGLPRWVCRVQKALPDNHRSDNEI